MLFIKQTIDNYKHIWKASFFIVKIIIHVSFKIYKSLLEHVEITSDPDMWETAGNFLYFRPQEQFSRDAILLRILAVFPLKFPQTSLHCLWCEQESLVYMITQEGKSIM